MKRQLLPVLTFVALLSITACGPLQVAAATSVSTTVAQTARPASIALPLQPTPRPTATSAAVITRSTSSSNSTATSAAQVAVQVFFTAGSHLIAEARQVPAAAPARGSLDALLAGPKVGGHFTQVPAGTRLLSVNLAAGTATVNFSAQVQNLEGSPAIPLFLGQVVNTLTQFSNVQRVVLEVNGQPLRSLGGEGVAVPEPLDQATVQRLLGGG